MNQLVRYAAICLSFLLLGTFSACDTTEKTIVDKVKPAKPTPPTSSNPSEPLKAEAEPPPPAPKLALATILTADRIYFKSADGAKQFQFKPKEADAVKFYDTAGNEICKLTMHPDKLKVKNEADQALFELKWHGDKLSFKDPQDKEIARLRFHHKNFEFEVGNDVKAKVMHEENFGYRVEDAAGMKLGTLTAEEGHAVYTSADGSKSLTCEKAADPIALVGFALPELTPAEQAAVFIYFVSRAEKK